MSKSVSIQEYTPLSGSLKRPAPKGTEQITTEDFVAAITGTPPKADADRFVEAVTGQYNPADLANFIQEISK